MIRRKILLDMPHPNYSTCNFMYTLKVCHGGIAIEDCEEAVEELGTGQDISSSDDSDYSFNDDSCEELLDDIMFIENVNKDAEWAGTSVEMEDDAHSSDTSYMSDDASDVSDFDSVASDDEVEEGRGIQKTTSSAHNNTLVLGKIFSTKQEFKNVVNNYSVVTGRPTQFTKNDAKRVYAKCRKRDEGCVWHIHLLNVNEELSFQIREIDLTHTCPRQFHVDNAKSG